jgi:hypothetical protein
MFERIEMNFGIFAMVPMWVLVHPSPIQLQLERNQVIIIIKGKMHRRNEMKNERERNEKWVVKFLLEMHEMKNERERERNENWVVKFLLEMN